MTGLLYFPLYALYVAAFLLFIYRARFFDIPGTKRVHFAFFFLLKVVAGLALTLVYTYYYTDQSKSDIYRYFNDSKIISSLLYWHPADWLKIMTGIGTYDGHTFAYLQNTLYFSHPEQDIITNNTLLIRIISLLNYLSGYNIYIDTLLLNCITFIAFTGLLKALQPYFESFSQILYWPLFLMPSIVFWSSGLLKEGLLFTGISLYVYCYLSPVLVNWKSFLFIVIALFIMAVTKIYVVWIIIMCSAFLPLPKHVKVSRFGLSIKWAINIIVLVLALVYGGDYLCRNIINKHNEFVQLALTEHSNSIVDTTMLTGGWNNIVALIPSALVNAVLRPFIFNRGPVLQMLFGAENFLFLASLMLLLLRYFKLPDSYKLSLAVFCFLFAVLNYLTIGLTVPIMGAIVHYRVIAMPFLLLSVLLMINLDKLKLDISRLSSLAPFKRQ